MNTSKPISTVTYNTEEFLRSVLEELLRKQVISYYMYIKHRGEINMVTGERDKDHIHLYVEPNYRINTMELSENFIEAVPGSKPLKCISWVSSKCDDWILYNLHDETYLLTKFEVREFHYTFDKVVCSDSDDGNRRFTGAYQSSGYAKNRNLYKYIKTGGTFEQLLEIGAISPNQVSYYNDFYLACKKLLSCQNKDV